MDYEKKYNEALAWMRELYPRFPGTFKEEIEHYFPELRESEDERIRKDLIYDIERLPMQGVLTHRPTSEYISYLEKQEQKPVSTEDMPYITDEHFYEREPADSFKYKLAEYMTKCCTKKEGPYGYTYGISAESILKMAEEELLKRGVVQKPAELSEEDGKKMIFLERLIEHNVPDGQYGWADGRKGGFVTKSEAISMLKSLRPVKHEWSEGDEKMLNEVLDRVTYAFYEQGNEGEIEDDPAFLWLHRLRPSWKPSEEQMKTLLNVEGDLRAFQHNDKAKIIAELYEQLKRL